MSMALPRIHPREHLVVVSNVLSQDISTTAKYMIREERNPGKPDCPGGLE